MTPTYKQLQRLQRSEIEHRRAVYGWNHPENIAWAESQGELSLRAYCRRIEDRLRALEHDDRQRVADMPAQAQAQAGADLAAHADEPLVIRRRGPGGKPHAK